jgi:Flp pilus assembly protein TadD
VPPTEQAPPPEAGSPAPDQTGMNEPAAQAPAAAAPQQTPPAAASQQTPEDKQLQAQLEQARALYWRRDMRGAALVYQSLSQAHPQNPDVWGEAGNFYFNLQQREQAANAYYHAAELLIQQGQQRRARQLLDVIYRLDKDKASALEARLQQ